MKLETSISGIQISVFRILFGTVLLYTAFEVKELGLHISKLDIRIKPELFEWIPDYSPISIIYCFYGLLISSIAIILGYKTKLFSAVYFFLYSFFLLSEISFFNNHYYLIDLVVFIYIFIPSENHLSFSKYLNDNSIVQHNIYLHLFWIRLQFILVFFWGGLVKLLSSDWMSGKVIESAYSEYSSFEISDSKAFNVAFYTYSGLVFDLCIGFILLSRFRFWGFIALFIFNIVNFINLNIGIFPVMLIFSMVLFIPTKCFEKLKFYKQAETIIPAQKRNYIGIKIFFFAFILFQILFPARHYFIHGNVDWTGEGSLFAWRMKLNHYHLQEFDYYFKNMKNEKIIPDKKLSNKQIRWLSTHPTAIVQVKNQWLKSMKDTSGMNFNVKLKIGLNGRSPSFIYNPNENLIHVKNEYFSHDKFIQPLP